MLPPQEVIEIDFERSPVYEAGAILLTVLALPNGDDKARGDLHGSLCHLALKAQFDRTDEASNQLQPMRPIHALRSEKEVRRDLSKLGRLLNDRMRAAHMAIPQLQAFVTGQPPKLPEGIKGLSLNELANLLESGQKSSIDAGNVETRIWRPSRPVIHLAVAIADSIDRVRREAGTDIHFGHFLQERWLIEWVVGAASEYAAIIAKGGVLRGKAVPMVAFQVHRAEVQK